MWPPCRSLAERASQPTTRWHRSARTRTMCGKPCVPSTGSEKPKIWQRLMSTPPEPPARPIGFTGRPSRRLRLYVSGWHPAPLADRAVRQSRKLPPVALLPLLDVDHLGVIGVGLGVAGGNLAAKLMKLAPVIPVDWALIGLGICSLVGIIFGTYPAHKAANLDPIESLRYAIARASCRARA